MVVINHDKDTCKAGIRVQSGAGQNERIFNLKKSFYSITLQICYNFKKIVIIICSEYLKRNKSMLFPINFVLSFYNFFVVGKYFMINLIFSKKVLNISILSIFLDEDKINYGL